MARLSTSSRSHGVRTTRLVLLNLDGRYRVPDRFYLPEDLEVLAVAADSTKASAAVVKTLIEAIDWSRLNELRDLIVRVGGLTAPPPIEVDLTFLKYLGRLERLDLGHGVWHRGPRPSPLEPPFPGLAKTLTQLHINAWEPEPLKQALHDYLPLSNPEGNPVGSVYQRYPYQPRRPWQMREHNGKWHVYGSLMEMPEIADAADPDSVAATESEALRLAKAKLRAADHPLLRRLDFDGESAGTGISANTRGDIERALAVLGLASRYTLRRLHIAMSTHPRPSARRRP
jgi:hypothetical protein